MKILITSPICPPEIGGPATYVSELGKRLSESHGITVITFTQKPKRIKKCKIVSIPHHKHFLGILFRQLKLAAAIYKYAVSADIIYAQGPVVVGFTSIIIGKLIGKPTIIKFVGDIAWEEAERKGETNLSLEEFLIKEKKSKTIQVLQWFQRSALEQASNIIVPSKYLKSILTNYYQIKEQKIEVIFNAVKVDIKPKKKKTSQLVFVGRLVLWKNINQIIKAVKLARKRHPWKLLIIGKGPEENNLKRQVEKLKADKWVSFTGRMSHQDTLKRIAESEKLILYSSYEGLSHTLIEAMHLKTTVIASDITANREVLRKYGIFALLNNTVALSEAVNKKQDINLSSAQRYAKNKYNWKNHISKLIKTKTSYETKNQPSFNKF